MNDSFYAMRASDRQKDELSIVNLRHGDVVSYAEELLQRDPEKDQYLEYDYLLATDGRHLVKAYMESDRIEIFELLGTDLRPRCVITGPENSVSSGYNDIICMGDRFVVCCERWIRRRKHIGGLRIRWQPVGPDCSFASADPYSLR